jgi:hypothetical protein
LTIHDCDKDLFQLPKDVDGEETDETNQDETESPHGLNQSPENVVVSTKSEQNEKTTPLDFHFEEAEYVEDDYSESDDESEGDLLKSVASMEHGLAPELELSASQSCSFRLDVPSTSVSQKLPHSDSSVVFPLLGSYSQRL